jgi:hypothetical protein
MESLDTVYGLNTACIGLARPSEPTFNVSYF